MKWKWFKPHFLIKWIIKSKLRYTFRRSSSVFWAGFNSNTCLNNSLIIGLTWSQKIIGLFCVITRPGVSYFGLSAEDFILWSVANSTTPVIRHVVTHSLSLFFHSFSLFLFIPLLCLLVPICINISLFRCFFWTLYAAICTCYLLWLERPVSLPVKSIMAPCWF